MNEQFQVKASTESYEAIISFTISNQLEDPLFESSIILTIEASGRAASSLQLLSYAHPPG